MNNINIFFMQLKTLKKTLQLTYWETQTVLKSKDGLTGLIKSQE